MDRATELYREYLNGNEDAAHGILDELFYGLVFFIDRIIRDVHASEDIALDVISDLFVGKPKYDFRTSLKTYVYMRAKSRALNHLRRRKRLVASELSEAEACPDERAELEAAVLKSERRREVDRAVEALPRDLREAVHLVYFEEMTYEEAARVMGKSRKQVDNLLFRAKKQLKVSLARE